LDAQGRALTTAAVARGETSEGALRKFQAMNAKKLSHYSTSGDVQMVDVSAKLPTTRTAAARGLVKMKPAVLRAVQRLKNPKGNPLEIARIAGIAAAKRTSEWIPLCHPLLLTHIDVTASLCQNGVELHSTVTTTAQTGVEMEALVAVSAAALTIYDMCKALDKSIEITGIVLVEKTGGKSGDFRRDGASSRAKSGSAWRSQSKKARVR
jgi:cyclic pyranopterin monophosphate synthase